MIVITGATGNVDTELVKTLSKRGQHARVIIRSRAQAQAIVLSEIDFDEGDSSKPVTFTRALVGIDLLFLLIRSSSEVEQ